MTFSKTFVRVSSVLLAAVLAWGGLASNACADSDSISINLGADQTSNSNYARPAENAKVGVVPVEGQYWNNASGNTGTFDSLISNTGAVTGVSGTWNSKNTYNYKGTKPSTSNNAILYLGYLDDGNASGTKPSYNMNAPYFSYDIYYYASTDSSAFRYVTINGVNYTGGSSGTQVGTGNWGTPVKAEIDAIDLVEGVNYLKVSSSGPTISILGQNASSSNRGSFGALQIVNTANSQSTTTGETSLTLLSTEISWNNDLTGATGQSFDSSAYGYRII